MKKILVAYYSRSGFTSAVAREIARICHADLEPIKDIRGHGQGGSYMRSALEAALHLSTTNRRVQHQPDSYDLVIIGTPIWCWNIASPVRAYINSHRALFKHVAFFCTYGGSGQGKVLQDLAALADQPAVATLELTDQEINDDKHHEKIARFIENLDRNVQKQKSASVHSILTSK
jgi:flavodoxin